MSYTRTFSKVIHVSGSVSVSYPASEHGGYTTAHYSENVPVIVNILVDTDNFDQSVQHTNDSVDMLTTAVTAMDEAQRVEIKKSADKVSDSLINGFYNVVNQDITSQKAEVKSVLQARFAKLLEESKKLQEIRDRMDEDVSRLKRHYYKIFKGLDDDLNRRIIALDKDAFAIHSHVTDELLVTPYLDSAGNGINEMNEESGVNQMITMGRIKTMSMNMVNQIADHLQKSADFKHSTASILSDTSCQRTVKEMIPVAYCSADDQTSAYCSENIAGKNKIENVVRNHIDHATDTQFEPLETEEKEPVEKALLGMMEESARNNEIDERTFSEMQRLWQNDKDRIRNLREVE